MNEQIKMQQFIFFLQIYVHFLSDFIESILENLNQESHANEVSC